MSRVEILPNSVGDDDISPKPIVIKVVIKKACRCALAHQTSD
ncbi:hypothetical protein M595_2866 [Lyngbya aestuarii BL J]|uniref:Uncharacterized protein n=1 Tax=Lyngbya aestuarii BL J TaxID=1348334 RepID=U7QIM5_9CYAN|nr:hypothetical protein M595_2866 [Lyngbya aestuarii BL J]